MTYDSKQDLIMLSDLFEAGKVRPVIERTYKLNETREAMRDLAEGHVCGKLVIAME